MANRTTFGGARWRSNLLTPNAKSPPIEICPVASAYGTVLYRGDFVKRLSTGYIEAAAAGDTIFGVFDGAERYYDGSVIRSGPKLPVSTYSTNFERQSMARVIPAFGQVFEMCTDDVGSSYDTYAEHLAFVGENCEWVAGTASGDESGTLLDISTHATTNTLTLRLHALSRHVDTDYAALGVRYLVTVNLLAQPTAGSSTGV